MNLLFCGDLVGRAVHDEHGDVGGERDVGRLGGEQQHPVDPVVVVGRNGARDGAAEAVAAGLADYYKDAATVKVHGLNEPLPENGLYSNAMAGTDRMELYLTVNAAGDQMMLVSLFDNLGKGSSGAAVQCMNLMLGLEETKGLE